MKSRQNLSRCGTLLLWGLVLAAACMPRSATTASYAPPAASNSQASLAGVSKDFGRMPLYFIKNRGQVEADVAYYLQGRNTSILFSAGGVTFDLTGSPERDGGDAPRSASLAPVALGRPFQQSGAKQRNVLKLDFVDANPGVKPTGTDPTPAVVSYFTGPRDEWKTGLKTYSKLVYPDLWPGIDLVYSGTVNRLKYTFLVKPGADPEQIRLAYRGASAVRVNKAGELEVSAPAGGLHDEKPYGYQEVDGKRVDVPTSYALAGAGPHESYQYVFSIGKYDRTRPLVLDPAVLIYAGYIGGAGNDRGLGIAVDSLGNAYVTGSIFNSFNSSDDAYVAKVNAAGTGLVYVGFIGGTAYDAGFDIAVDPLGNAYVTGATDSPESSFPAFLGPDVTYNGNGDAFVAKVNAAGTGLNYCGYIGGSGLDFAEGIRVDGAGNAYVTGPTNSPETTFPVTIGPDLTFNGAFDIFVAKVKAVPTSLIVTNNFYYNGYVGGSDDDIGILGGAGGRFATAGQIAVDAFGNAYVAGMTKSTEATFPTGNGFGSLVGFDQTFNGRYDAFVVKVKADGTGLAYATYLGGRGDEFGFGPAVDAFGNAYITGLTNSSEASFPVTIGPDLTYNGGTDAFVAKLNAAGTALIYCGYIGGKGFDQGLGLALDGAGNAHVIGHTHSAEDSFPVTGGPDLTYNGLHSHGDAFVVKVKAIPNDPVAKNNFDYSGYIGGAGEDAAFWVAVDGVGNAYIVGDTESDQTTFPNGNGFGSLPGLLGPDQTLNGGFDAFVVKITDPPASTGSSFGFTNQNVVGAPPSEAPSILYQDHLWKGRQIPK